MYIVAIQIVAQCHYYSNCSPNQLPYLISTIPGVPLKYCLMSENDHTRLFLFRSPTNSQFMTGRLLFSCECLA